MVKSGFSLNYAEILLLVIPTFMILILVEILYGHYTKKQTHSFMDTLSSLSSGMTNILKDSLGLVLIIVSYPYILESIAIVNLESSLTLYLVAFICVDFASYWNHRLNHKVNIFWNRHVIHHSSEEFNLACALRQSISSWIGFGALFLIPAALFGVPANIIALLACVILLNRVYITMGVSATLLLILVISIALIASLLSLFKRQNQQLIQ